MRTTFGQDGQASTAAKAGRGKVVQVQEGIMSMQRVLDLISVTLGVGVPVMKRARPRLYTDHPAHDWAHRTQHGGAVGAHSRLLDR